MKCTPQKITMNDNIKENILEKIRAGKLRMRPRWHFMLRVAATVLVALAVLVISVLIFNALIFTVRVHRHFELLGQGPGGYGLFLLRFPWWLLIVDIGLVLLLEWMLRAFRFAYRIPTLYLLAALAVLTIVMGGIVEERTPFNQHLRDRARRHHLPPPINDFYNQPDMPRPIW